MSLFAAVAPTASLHAEGLENVALGKTYTIHPPLPASKAVELKLLTDGEGAAELINGGEGALQLSIRRPRQITVDLKEIAPISGLSVNVAAGNAESGKAFNVWPGRIDIYTSDDNKLYYHAGELVSLHDAENGSLPPFGVVAERKIGTTRLATSGRYVRLVFSYGREVLMDEIEIYRGDKSLLAAPRQGKKFRGITETADAFALVSIDPSQEKPQAEAENLRKTKELQGFVFKRRYLQDIDALLEQAGELPAARQGTITAELRALRAEALKAEPQGNRYGTLPHGALGEKILQQQSAIWNAQGREGLILWQSASGEYLPWMATPPIATPDVAPRLTVRLMQGEYRSISFNLTNASREAKTLEIDLRGLPGGDNPGYITLHPVAWTETPWRLAVAAALPPGEKGEGGGYKLRVPAGMTQVVSLTIKGPESAGAIAGQVDIREVTESHTEAWQATVPVDLAVSTISYPKSQSLGLGGFELASNDSLRRRYGVFQAMLPEFVKTLREHRVNEPWTTRTEFSFGKFDANHDYASPGDHPDTKHFLNWTKTLLPGSNRYHVALTVGTKDHRAVMQGCDHASDPEGFQKRINRWLGFWRKVVIEANLQPEQIYFKIIDEPGFNAAAPYIDDEVIRIWANAIRQSGTGFKVFLNPIHDSPWEVDPQLYESVDVICVKYSHMLREDQRYMPFYQARGKELSIYECYGAPAHLYDPYSYFRLQAWMAWKVGAKSMFFWNFSETSTGMGFMDSWNNGLNHWYYTPFFLAPDCVISSIHSEAMRDGVQDYEYLEMLRLAVAARGEGEETERGRILLEKAAERVLGGEILSEPRWSWPRKNSREEADKVRLEILDVLESLQGSAVGKAKAKL